MSRPLGRVVVTILALVVHAAPTWAANWYVSPQGRSTAGGSRRFPWDIVSALGGRREIVPGDTIWIRGGRYHSPPKVNSQGFVIRLAGRKHQPIRIRAVPGQRATIDGGLDIQDPATYLEIRDLEITVSEPRPDHPVPPDPSYRNVNRPTGGLNVLAGTGCKFINLVIHDNNEGVGWWTPSKDSELYGCLIYDNGWAGTDRGHGHAIYTQNTEGIKTISDCIMTGGYGYSLHAYGSSRADVNNFLVVGNIVYNANTFLIGGGKPSHGIRVFDNVLYSAPMQLGYSAPRNDDCEVRNNIIINSGLSINKFEKVVNEGNVILAKGGPRPQGVRVILRPNKYDRHRAHLIVLNWEKRLEVDVDPGTFLKAGGHYRLLDPRDFFGKPVLTGSADGRPIHLPMKGEFAAFVLIKTEEEKSAKRSRGTRSQDDSAGRGHHR